MIKDSYENGECPDCGESIPAEMVSGGECANCGHVFHEHECEHQIDWSTLAPADGADGIVDVWCSECGVSGSVRINPEDIQW
jgi:hypothetical protein